MTERCSRGRRSSSTAHRAALARSPCRSRRRSVPRSPACAAPGMSSWSAPSGRITSSTTAARTSGRVTSATTSFSTTSGIGPWPIPEGPHVHGDADLQWRRPRRRQARTHPAPDARLDGRPPAGRANHKVPEPGRSARAHRARRSLKDYTRNRRHLPAAPHGRGHRSCGHGPCPGHAGHQRRSAVTGCP